MRHSDVVIIGAGPYGLSTAAHLRGLGVDFRIFGHPMQTWRRHMPKGMRLKSEGFASSISDPGTNFPLEAYCKEKGIPYAHTGLPVPLEVFSSYGMEFQRRYVPELEQKRVESVRRSAEGFRLQLDDGTVLYSRRVVVASGLANYEYVPPVLSSLPKELVTHSAEHHEVSHFRGRDVLVVGAGASAIDLAALLNETGARVEVIARRSVIRFHDPPSSSGPTLWQRFRSPVTGIGPGWKLYFYVKAPLIFRLLPQQFRLTKVREVLGPAPCWFTKQEVQGKVPMHVDKKIAEATVRGGRVRLRLVDGKGVETMLEADHLIAATGYRVDLKKLTFVDPALQSAITTAENAPVLSSQFESSVRGLYFVGISSANTFGPMLRFAYGADFAARRLSKHLAASARPGFTREESGSAEIPMDDRVAVR